MLPDKDDLSAINKICADNNWGGDAYYVRQIIQRAFPRDWKERRIFRKLKPCAFQLAKALTVLQTYLATQDIDEMIEWAYRDNFPQE